MSRGHVVFNASCACKTPRQTDDSVARDVSQHAEGTKRGLVTATVGRVASKELSLLDPQVKIKLGVAKVRQRDGTKRILKAVPEIRKHAGTPKKALEYLHEHYHVVQDVRRGGRIRKWVRRQRVWEGRGFRQGSVGLFPERAVGEGPPGEFPVRRYEEVSLDPPEMPEEMRERDIAEFVLWSPVLRPRTFAWSEEQPRSPWQKTRVTRAVMSYLIQDAKWDVEETAGLLASGTPYDKVADRLVVGQDDPKRGEQIWEPSVRIRHGAHALPFPPVDMGEYSQYPRDLLDYLAMYPGNDDDLEAILGLVAEGTTFPRLGMQWTPAAVKDALFAWATSTTGLDVYPPLDVQTRETIQDWVRQKLRQFTFPRADPLPKALPPLMPRPLVNVDSMQSNLFGEWHTRAEDGTLKYFHGTSAGWEATPLQAFTRIGQRVVLDPNGRPLPRERVWTQFAQNLMEDNMTLHRDGMAEWNYATMRSTVAQALANPHWGHMVSRRVAWFMFQMEGRQMLHTGPLQSLLQWARLRDAERYTYRSLDFPRKSASVDYAQLVIDMKTFKVHEDPASFAYRGIPWEKAHVRHMLIRFLVVFGKWPEATAVAFVDGGWQQDGPPPVLPAVSEPSFWDEVFETDVHSYGFVLPPGASPDDYIQALSHHDAWHSRGRPSVSYMAKYLLQGRDIDRTLPSWDDDALKAFLVEFLVAEEYGQWAPEQALWFVHLIPAEAEYGLSPEEQAYRLGRRTLHQEDDGTPNYGLVAHLLLDDTKLDRRGHAWGQARLQGVVRTYLMQFGGWPAGNATRFLVTPELRALYRPREERDEEEEGEQPMVARYGALWRKYSPHPLGATPLQVIEFVKREAVALLPREEGEVFARFRQQREGRLVDMGIAGAEARAVLQQRGKTQAEAARELQWLRRKRDIAHAEERIRFFTTRLAGMEGGRAVAFDTDRLASEDTAEYLQFRKTFSQTESAIDRFRHVLRDLRAGLSREQAAEVAERERSLARQRLAAKPHIAHAEARNRFHTQRLAGMEKDRAAAFAADATDDDTVDYREIRNSILDTEHAIFRHGHIIRYLTAGLSREHAAEIAEMELSLARRETMNAENKAMLVSERAGSEFHTHLLRSIAKREERIADLREQIRVQGVRPEVRARAAEIEALRRATSGGQAQWQRQQDPFMIERARGGLIPVVRSTAVFVIRLVEVLLQDRRIDRTSALWNVPRLVAFIQHYIAEQVNPAGLGIIDTAAEASAVEGAPPTPRPLNVAALIRRNEASAPGPAVVLRQLLAQEARHKALQGTTKKKKRPKPALVQQVDPLSVRPQPPRRPMREFAPREGDPSVRPPPPRHPLGEFAPRAGDPFVSLLAPREGGDVHARVVARLLEDPFLDRRGTAWEHGAVFAEAGQYLAQVARWSREDSDAFLGGARPRRLHAREAMNPAGKAALNPATAKPPAATRAMRIVKRGFHPAVKVKVKTQKARSKGADERILEAVTLPNIRQHATNPREMLAYLDAEYRYAFPQTVSPVRRFKRDVGIRTQLTELMTPLGGGTGPRTQVMDDAVDEARITDIATFVMWSKSFARVGQLWHQGEKIEAVRRYLATKAGWDEETREWFVTKGTVYEHLTMMPKVILGEQSPIIRGVIHTPYRRFGREQGPTVYPFPPPGVEEYTQYPKDLLDFLSTDPSNSRSGSEFARVSRFVLNGPFARVGPQWEDAAVKRVLSTDMRRIFGTGRGIAREIQTMNRETVVAPTAAVGGVGPRYPQPVRIVRVSSHRQYNAYRNPFVQPWAISAIDPDHTPEEWIGDLRAFPRVRHRHPPEKAHIDRAFSDNAIFDAIDAYQPGNRWLFFAQAMVENPNQDRTSASWDQPRAYAVLLRALQDPAMGNMDDERTVQWFLFQLRGLNAGRVGPRQLVLMERRAESDGLSGRNARYRGLNTNYAARVNTVMKRNRDWDAPLKAGERWTVARVRQDMIDVLVQFATWTTEEATRYVDSAEPRTIPTRVLSLPAPKLSFWDSVIVGQLPIDKVTLPPEATPMDYVHRLSERPPWQDSVGIPSSAYIAKFLMQDRDIVRVTPAWDNETLQATLIDFLASKNYAQWDREDAAFFVALLPREESYGLSPEEQAYRLGTRWSHQDEEGRPNYALVAKILLDGPYYPNQALNSRILDRRGYAWGQARVRRVVHEYLTVFGGWARDHADGFIANARVRTQLQPRSREEEEEEEEEEGEQPLMARYGVLWARYSEYPLGATPLQVIAIVRRHHSGLASGALPDQPGGARGAFEDPFERLQLKRVTAREERKGWSREERASIQDLLLLKTQAQRALRALNALPPTLPYIVTDGMKKTIAVLKKETKRTRAMLAGGRYGENAMERFRFQIRQREKTIRRVEIGIPAYEREKERKRLNTIIERPGLRIAQQDIALGSRAQGVFIPTGRTTVIFAIRVVEVLLSDRTIDRSGVLWNPPALVAFLRGWIATFSPSQLLVRPTQGRPYPLDVDTLIERVKVDAEPPGVVLQRLRLQAHGVPGGTKPKRAKRLAVENPFRTLLPPREGGDAAAQIAARMLEDPFLDRRGMAWARPVVFRVVYEYLEGVARWRRVDIDAFMRARRPRSVHARRARALTFSAKAGMDSSVRAYPHRPKRKEPRRRKKVLDPAVKVHRRRRKKKAVLDPAMKVDPRLLKTKARRKDSTRRILAAVPLVHQHTDTPQILVDYLHENYHPARAPELIPGGTLHMEGGVLHGVRDWSAQVRVRRGGKMVSEKVSVDRPPAPRWSREVKETDIAEFVLWSTSFDRLRSPAWFMTKVEDVVMLYLGKRGWNAEERDWLVETRETSFDDNALRRPRLRRGLGVDSLPEGDVPPLEPLPRPPFPTNLEHYATYPRDMIDYVVRHPWYRNLPDQVRAVLNLVGEATTFPRLGTPWQPEKVWTALHNYLQGAIGLFEEDEEILTMLNTLNIPREGRSTRPLLSRPPQPYWAWIVKRHGISRGADYWHSWTVGEDPGVLLRAALDLKLDETEEHILPATGIEVLLSLDKPWLDELNIDANQLRVAYSEMLLMDDSFRRRLYVAWDYPNLRKTVYNFLLTYPNLERMPARDARWFLFQVDGKLDERPSALDILLQMILSEQGELMGDDPGEAKTHVEFAHHVRLILKRWVSTDTGPKWTIKSVQEDMMEGLVHFGNWPRDKAHDFVYSDYLKEITPGDYPTTHLEWSNAYQLNRFPYYVDIKALPRGTTPAIYLEVLVHSPKFKFKGDDVPITGHIAKYIATARHIDRTGPEWDHKVLRQTLMDFLMAEAYGQWTHEQALWTVHTFINKYLFTALGPSAQELAFQLGRRTTHQRLDGRPIYGYVAHLLLDDHTIDRRGYTWGHAYLRDVVTTYLTEFGGWPIPRIQRFLSTPRIRRRFFPRNVQEEAEEEGEQPLMARYGVLWARYSEYPLGATPSEVIAIVRRHHPGLASGSLPDQPGGARGSFEDPFERLQLKRVTAQEERKGWSREERATIQDLLLLKTEAQRALRALNALPPTPPHILTDAMRATIDALKKEMKRYGEMLARVLASGRYDATPAVERFRLYIMGREASIRKTEIGRPAYEREVERQRLNTIIERPGLRIAQQDIALGSRAQGVFIPTGRTTVIFAIRVVEVLLSDRTIDRSGVLWNPPALVVFLRGWIATFSPKQLLVRPTQGRPYPLDVDTLIERVKADAEPPGVVLQRLRLQAHGAPGGKKRKRPKRLVDENPFRALLPPREGGDAAAQIAARMLEDPFLDRRGMAWARPVVFRVVYEYLEGVARWRRVDIDAFMRARRPRSVHTRERLSFTSSANAALIPAVPMDARLVTPNAALAPAMKVDVRLLKAKTRKKDSTRRILAAVALVHQHTQTPQILIDYLHENYHPPRKHGPIAGGRIRKWVIRQRVWEGQEFRKGSLRLFPERAVGEGPPGEFPVRRVEEVSLDPPPAPRWSREVKETDIAAFVMWNTSFDRASPAWEEALVSYAVMRYLMGRGWNKEELDWVMETRETPFDKSVFVDRKVTRGQQVRDFNLWVTTPILPVAFLAERSQHSQYPQDLIDYFVSLPWYRNDPLHTRRVLQQVAESTDFPRLGPQWSAPAVRVALRKYIVRYDAANQDWRFRELADSVIPAHGTRATPLPPRPPQLSGHWPRQEQLFGREDLQPTFGEHPYQWWTVGDRREDFMEEVLDMWVAEGLDFSPREILDHLWRLGVPRFRGTPVSRQDRIVTYVTLLFNADGVMRVGPEWSYTRIRPFLYTYMRGLQVSKRAANWILFQLHGRLSKQLTPLEWVLRNALRSLRKRGNPGGTQMRFLFGNIARTFLLGALDLQGPQWTRAHVEEDMREGLVHFAHWTPEKARAFISGGYRAALFRGQWPLTRLTYPFVLQLTGGQPGGFDILPVGTTPKRYLEVLITTPFFTDEDGIPAIGWIAKYLVTNRDIARIGPEWDHKALRATLMDFLMAEEYGQWSHEQALWAVHTFKIWDQLNHVDLYAQSLSAQEKAFQLGRRTTYQTPDGHPNYGLVAHLLLDDPTIDRRGYTWGHAYLRDVVTTYLTDFGNWPAPRIDRFLTIAAVRDGYRPRDIEEEKEEEEEGEEEEGEDSISPLAARYGALWRKYSPYPLGATPLEVIEFVKREPAPLVTGQQKEFAGAVSITHVPPAFAIRVAEVLLQDRRIDRTGPAWDEPALGNFVKGYINDTIGTKRLRLTQWKPSVLRGVAVGPMLDVDALITKNTQTRTKPEDMLRRLIAQEAALGLPEAQKPKRAKTLTAEDPFRTPLPPREGGNVHARIAARMLEDPFLDRRGPMWSRTENPRAYRRGPAWEPGAVFAVVGRYLGRVGHWRFGDVDAFLHAPPVRPTFQST